MTYRLQFAAEAHKEWLRLDSAIRSQFAKKLKERLSHPRVPADAMRKMPDCYKIKLRRSGFRLVYQVRDDIVVVLVFAVGKREADAVYLEAARRFGRND